jgi:DNA-binding beta-propeller fold protein YncE
MPGRFCTMLCLSVVLVVAGLVSASRAGNDEKKQNHNATKTAAAKSQAQFVDLAWPEAPETPRIKVVDILASEADLGRKITTRESMMKFLTGTKPQIAHIYQPRDVAVSDDGNRVYASDFGQSVIFIFDLEQRKVSTIRSETPFGLALDAHENLYVVEQESKRIVVFDRQGSKLRVITHPRLIRPTDIAIDRQRKLIYVADPGKKNSEEHSVKVLNFEGELVRTIGKGKGDCPGCLFFPTYVAIDKAGNIYVTSTLNARVDVFDPTGNYLRTIGERGTSFGMFDKPKGVALDSFGNIYVADSGWSNVQIFNQKGEVLLFFGGRGDYPGLLKNPTGIAIDKNNKIYVADYLNYRLTVYQLVNTKAEDSYIALPASPARNEEKAVK